MKEKKSPYYKNHQIIISKDEKFLYEGIKNNSEVIKLRSANVKWRAIAPRLYLDALERVANMKSDEFKKYIADIQKKYSGD